MNTFNSGDWVENDRGDALIVLTEAAGWVDVLHASPIKFGVYRASSLRHSCLPYPSWLQAVVDRETNPCREANLQDELTLLRERYENRVALAQYEVDRLRAAIAEREKEPTAEEWRVAINYELSPDSRALTELEGYARCLAYERAKSQQTTQQ